MTLALTSRTLTGSPSHAEAPGVSDSGRSQTTRPVAVSISSTRPACPTATTPPLAERVRARAEAALVKLAVPLVEEDQDEADRGDEAEGRLLSVPGLRLPHLEPFAAHDQEPEEPQEESEDER